MDKVNLPDLPSELIRLALADLEKVEASRLYVVDMDHWHLSNDRLDKKCSVCFAGAVIAGTLHGRPSEDLSPFSFDSPISEKLHALDNFRAGRVDSAFDLMDLGYKNGTGFNIDYIPEYGNDAKGFKESLKKMASDLSAAGY